MKGIKTFKEWKHDVNKVSADMMNWALNLQDKQAEKKQKGEVLLDVKKRHIIFAFFVLLILSIGFLLGYYYGLDVCRDYYRPLLETACEGCICLN